MEQRLRRRRFRKVGAVYKPTHRHRLLKFTKEHGTAIAILISAASLGLSGFNAYFSNRSSFKELSDVRVVASMASSPFGLWATGGTPGDSTSVGTCLIVAEPRWDRVAFDIRQVQGPEVEVSWILFNCYLSIDGRSMFYPGDSWRIINENAARMMLPMELTGGEKEFTFSKCITASIAWPQLNEYRKKFVPNKSTVKAALQIQLKGHKPIILDVSQEMLEFMVSGRMEHDLAMPVRSPGSHS